MKQETGTVVFTILFSITTMQQTDGPSRCVIIQDKMSIAVPFEHPSYLMHHNKTHCQTQRKGQGFLRCGASDVYIKKECVCSFYNVYEATMHHQYSSCPVGEESDLVTKLKCPDCRKYSLDNNGPCINGGKLTCKGNEVSPHITCKCPPNFQGKFCEEKLENVTRLCDKISASSAIGLRSCDFTKRDCVTYSRTRKYAYKCKETETSQDRQGLPSCIDTEDITVSPEVSTNTSTTTTTTSTTSTTESNRVDYLNSGVQPRMPSPAVIFGLVTFQLCCSKV